MDDLENYLYPKGYKPIKRRSQIKSWLDLELYHRYKADRAVKTIRKIREIRAKYEGTPEEFVQFIAMNQIP